MLADILTKSLEILQNYHSSLIKCLLSEIYRVLLIRPLFEMRTFMRSNDHGMHLPLTKLQACYLSSTLFQCLRKELILAMASFSGKRVTKVAFPAVGTGNLKYCTDDVADVMLDVIDTYFLIHNDIKKVYIVIHYPDEKSLQVGLQFVCTHTHTLVCG